MPTPTPKKLRGPIACNYDSKDPDTIHYDVRFICHASGLHYCYDHRHPDMCCKGLPTEFFRENDEEAKRLCMPLCNLCNERIPQERKQEHAVECMRDYIRGHKSKKKQEYTAHDPGSNVYVRDQQLVYEMRDELPLRPKGKRPREVKFTEGR